MTGPHLPGFAVASLLVLTLSLGGCVNQDSGDVRLVLNAPQTGDALQVGVFVDKADASAAEFQILFEGVQAYPKSGKAKMTLVSGAGDAKTNYAEFVRGNGDYTVKASSGSKSSEKSVEIVKFVESVRVQISYNPDAARVQVQAGLLAAKAHSGLASPGTVVTKGDGELNFYKEDSSAPSNPQPFRLSLADAQSALTWQVSTSEFDQGRGNYTGVVTFKNKLAVGNTASNDPYFAATAKFELQ
ncbi:MAG: hypothetical protein HY556_11740 [Euryarchaeota archaeon]|nr:hypothetical protein [Euryarchaeota archaeon]